MTKESVWLNKLVELDFENFKKNNQIKNFWTEKELLDKVREMYSMEK